MILIMVRDVTCKMNDSFGGIPNSRNVFFKSFWSVLPSQALETHRLGFRELNGRKSCWTCSALHQSLPDLLRNPVEPDLALHQSLLEPSPKPSPKPRYLLVTVTVTQLLSTQYSAPKPPTPSPEPSPEPCWTWPGCTKASRSQTFSATLA